MPPIRTHLATIPERGTVAIPLQTSLHASRHPRRPVLAIFLDGLGADAVSRMSFVAALPSVRRLRTELGYSITCHASMYTGLRPDRHGLWFVWQRDAARSPFRWLRPLGFLSTIDNLALRVLVTKITRRFTRTTSWFGVPYPVHVPWRDLPELDVAERRLWSDPGYLDTAPTIFDLWRSAGVSVEIVGMARGHSAGLAGIEAWSPPPVPADVTYLFAGDIDHASHAHGQGSIAVGDVLARVDRVIRRVHGELCSIAGEVDLVLWSDHGHHDVERLDPFELLAKNGISLDGLLHVIDTNFIRVWVDGDDRRRALANQLDATRVGHVLTEEELDRYRVRLPDNRYGDLIFYLDLPYAFSRTIWGFGRRLASAHGYLPDHPQSDGVLASSRGVREGDIQLADIAPSLLALTHTETPANLDGSAFWGRGP